MTKYNNITELKDAINIAMPRYFKDGKALGVYKLVHIKNNVFLELAEVWGGEFATTLKMFDGNVVHNLKREFTQERVTDKKQALKILAV